MRKWSLLTFFSLVFLSIQAQDKLSQEISIKLDQVQVADALDQIAASTDFSFVYNTDLVANLQPVSVNENNVPIREVLDDIFARKFTYLERGKYVILQPVKTNTKVTFQIKGELTDANTGKKIEEATIVEIGKLSSSISDKSGQYNLKVDSKTEVTTLIVSKENYEDTIIQISDLDAKSLDIKLKPIGQNVSIASVDSPPQEIVESRKFVRFFVSRKNRKNTENVDFLERRVAQISLVPVVGTNRQMGGSITNHMSLNILAGYSYGVEGFEVGGIANIVKKDVDGLQLGGVANVTGGNTTGVQLAGVVNTNIGTVKGAHMAGFANFAADTVNGFQGSGFFNIAKHNRGFQGSGFFNWTYQSSGGVQAAGFFNAAQSNQNALQASGFFNWTSQEMKGAQLSGFFNRSGDLDGLQMTGFANSSGGKVQGTQISGLINAAGDVDGGQITGILNIAKEVKGVQIGLINIADTVSRGITVGLINFVKRGFIHLELHSSDIMPIGASFKSGTYKFYTSINAAIRPQSDLWTYGLGVGRQFNFFKYFYANPEISWNTIVPLKETENDQGNWTKYQLLIGVKMTDNISMFVGPNFNVYRTRYVNPDTGELGHDLGIDPIDEKRTDTRLRQNWMGFQAGIRF